MKKLICALIFFSIGLKAQDKQPNSNGINSLWALKYGGSYQKSGFAELGIIRAFYNVEKNMNRPFFLYWGPSFGSEFKLSQRNFLIGPKAGLELYDLNSCLAAKINIINYTNFKQNDLRIITEIGLTMIGLFNLFYGYSVPLNHNEFKDVGQHKISLIINVPRSTFK